VTGRQLRGHSTSTSRWRFAWRDIWSEWRNRLLASSRFHHWASRFPLTRPIARKRAQSLFDLCAGFVYSQVLLACVQLRLFEFLAAGPQSLATLTPKLSLTEDGATRLLDAAVALELAEKRGPELYGLGPLGAVIVANDGIEAMVRHHPMLYEDLLDPLPLLRGEAGPTRLGQYWPYAESQHASNLDSEQVSPYSELMAASQTLIAQEVLNTYSLRRHRCLLDVGGGGGAFLAAVAARWPDLRLMLFDLPAVVEQSETRLAQIEPQDRVRAVGGDFFSDPLPEGADIISLVRIIHDHDDADVLRLLQSIRRSLPRGGTLLLAEPMAGHSDTDRVAHAYFGFYLMAMGKGRARSPEEIGGLLQQAGFNRHRLLSNGMPLQTRVMVAS